MKYNIVKLFFWYLIYKIFVNDALRDYLVYGETDAFDYTHIYSWTGLFIFFLFPLGVYTALYKYYPKKKWFALIIAVLVTFILPIIIRYLIEEVILYHLFGMNNYYINHTLDFYYRDNTLFALRLVPLAFMYYFYQYGLLKQKNESELQIENQKIELNFLRSQINPHFLLNNLNSIYSLVYHSSPKAIGALDKLMELLKYNLYENDDFANLGTEMKMIQNYIQLQQLRSDSPLQIEIDCDKKLYDLEVPSFVLQTLIENGIKHGHLKDPSKPFTLKVWEENDQIQISSVNYVSSKIKDKTSGIGLENLKRRLKLLYSNQSDFKINETHELYEVYISFAQK